jgi:hypothetical protein
MAWSDHMRVYARCPKHIRFNPSNGQGAVKGGCLTCLELTVYYREFEALRRRIKSFCDATALRRAS